MYSFPAKRGGGLIFIAISFRLYIFAALPHTSAADMVWSRGGNDGVLMLAAAGMAQYCAARLALHAIARTDGADPGRRAIGQWLPIAACALMAVLMRQPTVAICIVLGTSVACLSLAAGLVLFMSPIEALPPQRRAWPFLLPAALLPLVAGFSGTLRLWHAAAMLLFGLAILQVWRLEIPLAQGESTAQPLGPPPARRIGWILVGVATVIAFAGAYFAVGGAVSMAGLRYTLTPGLIASIFLSPLLLLPTIGTAAAVAQHGRVGSALSALVGTALLNLCVLLPMVVLLHAVRNAARSPEPAFLIEWLRIPAPPIILPPLNFPMAAWRVDTVILVVLGLAAVPIATGRWILGKLDGILLIAGFFAYIIAEAFVAVLAKG